MSRFHRLLAQLLPIAVFTMTGLGTSHSAHASVNSMAIDTTFGANGTVSSPTLAVTSARPLNADTVLLPSGKSLTAHLNDSGLVIERLNSDGTIDHSFGINGSTASLPASLSNNNGYFPVSMAVGTDGRIIVVLQYSTGWRAVAFTSVGVIDSNFGDGGVANSPSYANRRLIFYTRVHVTSNGKIFVVGMSTGPTNSSDVIVTRLRANGTLDPTYGFSGTADAAYCTTAGRQASTVSDSQLDTQGRIVVAGICPDGNQTASVVVRFLTDGTLDNGWGDTIGYQRSGVATLPRNGLDWVDMNSITTDGADGYYLSGTTNSDGGSVDKLAVAHIDSVGGLDASFGTAGIASTSYSVWSMVGLARTSDGKLLVGANIPTGQNDWDSYLFSFTTTGTLDSAFGINGKLTIPLPPVHPDYRAIFIRMAVASNGAIRMGVGYVDPAAFMQSDFDFHVLNMNQNGSWDTSFSSNYEAANHLINGNEQLFPFSVLRSLNGKITVVSYSRIETTNEMTVVISRYTQSGVLDTSFATNGVSEFKIHDKSVTITGSLMQPDGKIVIAGQLGSQWPPSETFVMRLNVNGSPDSAFGTAGISTVSTDTPSATQIALDSHGRIVVLGREGSGSDQNFVARLLPNGSFDNSFDGPSNGDGKVHFANDYWFSSLLIDSEDRVIVGGSLLNESVILQLDSTGSLVNNFGTAGVMSIDPTIGGARPYGYIDNMIFSADGNLVVSMNQGNDATWNVSVLIGVTSSGTINNSFGSGNAVQVPSSCAPDSQHDSISSILKDGSGILVAAYSQPDDQRMGGTTIRCVVRYDSSGTVDTSFGESGTIISSSANTSYSWAVLERESASSWYVIDSVQPPNAPAAWHLLRYTPFVATTTSGPSTTTTTTTAPTSTTSPSTTIVTSQQSSTTTNVPTSTSPINNSGTIIPISSDAVVAVPTIRKSSATAYASVANKLRIGRPPGSTTTVTVAKSSSKTCSISKGKLVALTTGRCSVTVSIVTKGGGAVTFKGILVIT